MVAHANRLSSGPIRDFLMFSPRAALGTLRSLTRARLRNTVQAGGAVRLVFPIMPSARSGLVIEVWIL